MTWEQVLPLHLPAMVGLSLASQRWALQGQFAGQRKDSLIEVVGTAKHLASVVPPMASR
jgi:hypothetical protein